MANETERWDGTSDPRRAELGAAIRRTRRKALLSQEALADEVGTHQNTISTWERGESEPRPDFVFKIEQACGDRPGSLSRYLGYMPITASASPHCVYDCILDDPDLTRLGKALLRELYLVVVKHTRRRGPIESARLKSQFPGPSPKDDFPQLDRFR